MSASATIIRAAHLQTMTVRDLTDSATFRTAPDVLGTRVVWEDHRSGNGDIHMLDLSAEPATVDQVVVSEPSHSTHPRLVDGGLVWIEAHADRIELRRLLRTE